VPVNLGLNRQFDLRKTRLPEQPIEPSTDPTVATELSLVLLKSFPHHIECRTRRIQPEQADVILARSDPAARTRDSAHLPQNVRGICHVFEKIARIHEVERFIREVEVMGISLNVSHVGMLRGRRNLSSSLFDSDDVDVRRGGSHVGGEKPESAADLKNVRAGKNAQKFNECPIRESIQPRESLLLLWRRTVNICS
jgi:hypothetical protein